MMRRIAPKGDKGSRARKPPAGGAGVAVCLLVLSWCIPLSASGRCPSPPAVPNTSSVQLGRSGQVLLTRAIQELCEARPVREALINTCATPAANDASELEARLRRDVLGVAMAPLKQRAVNEASQAHSVPHARVLVAILESSFGGCPGLEGLLLALPANQLRCGGAGKAKPERAQLVAAIAVVRELSRSPAEPEAAVREAIRLAGCTQALIPPDARLGAHLAQLQRALVELRQIEQSLSSADDYVALVSAETEIVKHALGIVGARVEWLELAKVLASAWASSSLEQMIQLLDAWLPYDSEAVAAVKLLVRLLGAKDEAQLKRILAKSALGLGPWSDAWLFGGSALLPVVGARNYRVVGDVTLGYQLESWGGVVRGALTSYDLSSASVLSDTTSTQAGLEFWYASLGESIRFELRSDLGVGLYDTSSTPSGASPSFSDENSLLLRGAGLLGVRLVSPRSALGVWLGGGAEHEAYDQLSVVTAPAAAAHVEDSTHLSVVWRGRVRAQFALFPEVLSLRFHGDTRLHTLTRESTALDITARAVSTEKHTEAREQWEGSSRFFADWELLRWFGVVPSLSAGVEVVSSETTSERLVLGAGLRATEF